MAAITERWISINSNHEQLVEITGTKKATPKEIEPEKVRSEFMRLAGMISQLGG